MGKTLDIITIICAISLIISMFVFEPSMYINFKYGWMKYLFIFMLILAIIISWMNLKGKFKGRNLRLAEKFYNQGLAFNMRGDLNAAISNYKMALNIDSDFAPAHKALGHAFFLRGEMKSLKHIKVNNIEAVEAIYTALSGKIKKVGFVKDGIEYVISCGTKPNLFDEYEPIFDACIQSLKFTDQMVKILKR